MPRRQPAKTLSFEKKWHTARLSFHNQKASLDYAREAFLHKHRIGDSLFSCRQVRHVMGIEILHKIGDHALVVGAKTKIGDILNALHSV